MWNVKIRIAFDFWGEPYFNWLVNPLRPEKHGQVQFLTEINSPLFQFLLNSHGYSPASLLLVFPFQLNFPIYFRWNFFKELTPNSSTCTHRYRQWLSTTETSLPKSMMTKIMAEFHHKRTVCLDFYQDPDDCFTWWRHQMETFSALLAICVGNSSVTGEFPAQRPETRSFDFVFDMRLNKRLSRQSWGWWFDTPSHPLWRHWNESLYDICSQWWYIGTSKKTTERRSSVKITSGALSLTWVNFNSTGISNCIH